MAIGRPTGGVPYTGKLPVVRGFQKRPDAGDIGAINGALTATEADDSLSSTATVLVAGTLTATEANDTLSSTATVLVSASLTATEASDTLGSTGIVLVSGSLTATEASDTLSSAGTVLVTGALTATEAADLLAASGGPIAAASLTATEADDALSASGTVSGGLVPITGALTATEADDVLAATAQLYTIVSRGGGAGGAAGGGVSGGYIPSYLVPKPSRGVRGGRIEIKSEAQRQMLERVANDPQEAARRGMTTEQAKASLAVTTAAHSGHHLPHRIGKERPNRHGRLSRRH